MKGVYIEQYTGVGIRSVDPCKDQLGDAVSVKIHEGISNRFTGDDPLADVTFICLAEMADLGVFRLSVPLNYGVVCVDVIPHKDVRRDSDCRIPIPVKPCLDSPSVQGEGNL